MNRLRDIQRRFSPWLRGALAAYLVGVLALAALHQHHDATRGHDCALCTVAHTPAVVAHSAAVPVIEHSQDPAPLFDAGGAPDVAPLRAPSSRAPPLT